MLLTEEDIKNLPVISEEEDDFYAPGEFEAAVLADFNEEADRIDEKYRSRTDSLDDRTVSTGEIIPKEGVIVVDSIEEFMQSNGAVHLKDLDIELRNSEPSFSCRRSNER